MRSINPIAWWRRRAQRDSRNAFGAAEEELYELLDEASKVSAA
jgi:hypothetical protein